MDEPVDVLKEIVKNLTDLQIEYFLVGPIATAQQKKSFTVTRNINIVLDRQHTKIKDFLNRFVLDHYICPLFDVLYDDVKAQKPFTLYHEASKVKVTFELRKESAIALSEFSRKTLLQVEPDFGVFVSTPEDVILKKLEFYCIAPSPQYIADVRKLIYHNEVDQDYLDLWIDKLALSLAWGRASKN